MTISTVVGGPKEEETVSIRYNPTDTKTDGPYVRWVEKVDPKTTVVTSDFSSYPKRRWETVQRRGRREESGSL